MKNYFKKKKKASISIASLAYVFIELLCFVVFLPMINYFIAQALPQLADDPMAMWFLKLIPLVLVIAITMSVFNKDQQLAAQRGY